MLRAAREARTELGVTAQGYMDRGELVPDQVIIAMLLERLEADDARDGFLLDGFPRTIEQADALAASLAEHGRSLTAALLIDAPDDVVVQRISGRRISPSTGRVYHVDFDPPASKGAATSTAPSSSSARTIEPRRSGGVCRSTMRRPSRSSTTTRLAASCAGSMGRFRPTRSTPISAPHSSTVRREEAL